MYNLRDLLNKAYNRDEEAMLNIIETFRPYYKKLLRKASYCIEESDLIIHIIHMINKLGPEKSSNFKSNGQIFNYIKNGITNKYIQLLSRYFAIQANEILLNEDIFPLLSNQENELSENVYIEELLNHLTRLQKRVIIDKIIYDKTDIEIAGELNISRQSVNRIKNRALKKLKDYL